MAYALSLAISGSHTLTDAFGARPGFTAQGSLFYDIRDNRTGDVFASGFFDSSDSVPSATVLAKFIVPADDVSDDIRFDISLDTFAYVSNADPAFQTAEADYSHTLVVHLDALTAGANTRGISGFDYASAALGGVPGGVPEPGTLSLLVAAIMSAAWSRSLRRPWQPGRL
jgi:hypothetical protein